MRYLILVKYILYKSSSQVATISIKIIITIIIVKCNELMYKIRSVTKFTKRSKLRIDGNIEYLIYYVIYGTY